MIQGNHPVSVNLAHQPGVDSVLRMLRAYELVLTDQLRCIGCEHFNLDVMEGQRAARIGGAAVVADLVIERALPSLLEPTA